MPFGRCSLANNCTSGQVQSAEHESSMGLQAFRGTFPVIFYWPDFMDSLNCLNQPRRSVLYSAQRLTTRLRVALVRRFSSPCSVAVILMVLSLAGCQGYSSPGGNGPNAPYITTQPVT